MLFQYPGHTSILTDSNFVFKFIDVDNAFPQNFKHP